MCEALQGGLDCRWVSSLPQQCASYCNRPFIIITSNLYHSRVLRPRQRSGLCFTARFPGTSDLWSLFQSCRSFPEGSFAFGWLHVLSWLLMLPVCGTAALSLDPVVPGTVQLHSKSSHLKQAWEDRASCLVQHGGSIGEPGVQQPKY